MPSVRDKLARDSVVSIVENALKDFRAKLSLSSLFVLALALRALWLYAPVVVESRSIDIAKNAFKQSVQV